MINLQKIQQEEISMCPSCHCMTHSRIESNNCTEHDVCGKCGANKTMNPLKKQLQEAIEKRDSQWIEILQAAQQAKEEVIDSVMGIIVGQSYSISEDIQGHQIAEVDLTGVKKELSRLNNK
jgi:NMD protein affecting ribosome stability and mRNA decay